MSRNHWDRIDGGVHDAEAEPVDANQLPAQNRNDDGPIRAQMAIIHQKLTDNPRDRETALRYATELLDRILASRNHDLACDAIRHWNYYAWATKSCRLIDREVLTIVRAKVPKLRDLCPTGADDSAFTTCFATE